MTVNRADVLAFAQRMMAFDGQQVLAANAVVEIDTAPEHHHPEDSWRKRLMLGTQEGLRKLGLRVPSTGYADAVTAHALVGVVGPRWRLQPWRQIFEALYEAGAR